MLGITFINKYKQDLKGGEKKAGILETIEPQE
jgi:hypothetical protein